MSHSDPQNSPTAVKPHLSSVITQTIGRQLHNVASFLAPPPQQSYSSPTPPRSDVSPSSYEGLKNDLAEIGVSLKTGLSLLSPKKAVTGISKFASSFLQFDKGDADRVVGVTDHVVDFVREVSVRPHCWVDFPLSLLNKDFSMSQVQKDHAIIIQDLVPNLAALRRTIHNVMSEQQFWMIYFIMLVPQLNEDDCRLLSTPEILQMHEALLRKLRNKKNTPIATEDTLDEKGSMVNITKPESSSETDNAANMTKNKNRTSDVCFSDIEDEEFKQTQSSRVSSASENSDWVRIGGTSKTNRSRYRGRQSESEESSSDWHAVEDLDL
ncbi:putative BSD domain superfamily protein [Helianthus annuus]|nr:putative BSD domain superfamily protein [Helianthus annuus]